jgi:integrase
VPHNPTPPRKHRPVAQRMGRPVSSRRPAGQIFIDTRRSSPTYALRLRVGGRRRYVRLGSEAEGWNPAKAEMELQNLLADARRGIWQPPAPEVAEAPRETPTFHEFSSEWFERQTLEGGRQGRGLAEKSRKDLEWRLTNHLLPAFASKRLDQITVKDVDDYRLGKAREGRLSPATINKTITALASILEAAVEYELIGRNPARGRRRRLPATPPKRPWIDRADHIAALLAAAGELDEQARVARGQRRAVLATLIFAGLRIGEAQALRWRDVDLARATITVRASKTDAGIRTVNLLPILRDELADYRARLDPQSDALAFATSTGRRQGATNIRRRVLAKAVERANEQLAKQRIEPLPQGLTPHSLRRTFASLLFALGETPPYVMAQMGHTTPNLTLAIYARQMDRRDGEPERLKALVEGRDLPSLSSYRRGVGRVG